MLYCIEGTVRSKRKMEGSRTGPSLPLSSQAADTEKKPDVRKVILPLHQTVSIQWDPPAEWQSQLGHGEDIEKLPGEPNVDEMAFVRLRRASTEASGRTETNQTDGSRRSLLGGLRPLRPENTRRTSDKSSDGIQVVVEKCVVVEEA